MTQKSVLRHLPSIDRLLRDPSGSLLVRDYGHQLAVEALRDVLEQLRRQLSEREYAIPADDVLVGQARDAIETWGSSSLQHVINATGVIIHTNLGRAPLSDAAIEAIRDVAQGYSTLEFDLRSGKRGARGAYTEELLCKITGAEAALVVNNNAAAVLLALATLAGPTPDAPQGRGVIISRGQLVEIGGGFRVPDVMAQSGAQLIEVGTTNRTHLYDYENAIDKNVALLLRAHRSNFAMVGFTTEPTLAELIEVAHRHDLLVLDDLGSGALIDTSQFGLAGEPMIQNSVRAGVDVTMFSGDKLLGGPQSGILAGKASVIERLRRNPLARAVRADKLCLAGLSATLLHYLKGEALTHIPIWQMISMDAVSVRERAESLAGELRKAGLQCDVVQEQSTIGGGSLPGEMLPSAQVSIRTPDPELAAARLRSRKPPVIARIYDGKLLIDPRTVLRRDEGELLAALRALPEILEENPDEIRS